MLEAVADRPIALVLTLAESVADAIAEEVSREPDRDARLVACDRRSLQHDPSIEPRLCHLAPTPLPPAPLGSPARRRPTRAGNAAMVVRDWMNLIVVTIGPSHTVREAARRMTAHGVGAAVVADNEQPGPGIITERDILHVDARQRALSAGAGSELRP